MQKAQAKLRANPMHRLSDAVSSNVNNGIRKGSKQGRRTFEVLGYTVEQLMAHLEAQFTAGMSWDTYGRNGWHIDHIIPVSVHHFQTPDDADFKRAWALQNLRPMWAADNIRKGNRLQKPFQPSLAF